jgi:raffinose/stachyose/melibiose transport system permease protein
MMVSKTGIIGKTFFYILAIAFLVIFGFPFVLTFFMSFKSMSEYMAGNFWGLPKKIFFDNFRRVLAANFLIFFRNSIIVSSISVALVTIFASLASYAFAKLKFRFNGAIFLLIIVGMMIPIHTTLIPIYQMNKALRFTNSFAGLVGPYVSFGLPTAIYIITSFFKEVPNSIQESAYIDGASPFRIYLSIMLPISVPAISTSAILNFLAFWNEFIVAMTMLNSTSKHTLPLGMRQFYGTENINIPAVLTAVLVGSLPVLIFYVFAQEKVINGLSAGAVKG